MTHELDLLTVVQAAEELGIARRTVHKWITAGRLKATKVGDGRTSSYVIERAEIERAKAAA